MSRTDNTSKPRILVVDDVRDNLDLMTQVLESGTWGIATARSAAHALERVSKELFDLFLLDVQMPDMDGFELCRRLRSDPITRSVPVIFITAERTTSANVIEGLDAGGFDYITKPFDQAELLARVRVMLRLRAAERRLLTVQGALDAQNQQLSAMNDRLAEACQQMLEHRVELTRKTQELERANRVKSEFLAKMSHELRTPLNSIIGFSDLMIADKNEVPTDGQAKRLEKIGRNGRQLLALINDILDLSKIEADHLTLTLAPVDVPVMARECIELARPLVQEKPVTFEADIPSELPPWEGDELRLRQVVTNLLSNAAKFTDRGTITLQVKGHSDGISIVVTDTGIGISPEHLGCVFDPFRQVDSSSSRRAGGTGLGLPICRKLCHLMGGGIQARSQPGMGSTFEVTLPWRLEACNLRDESDSYKGPPPPSGVIVLCSDDAGTVDLTTSHLAMHGFEVRHVDGKERLRNTLRLEQPAGVIFDLNAPQVLALLRLVKSADPPIPCTCLCVWTEDHQLGYVVQLDDYMIGPEDATVATRSLSARPDEIVLGYASSEAARRDLERALADVGFKAIRVVADTEEAIRELSSGRVQDLFVHLAGFDPAALHLANRVRQMPEWASVRIIGLVPSADDVSNEEYNVAALDQFVRQHGAATPTLLVDLAEKLITTQGLAKVGACV